MSAPQSSTTKGDRMKCRNVRIRGGSLLMFVVLCALAMSPVRAGASSQTTPDPADLAPPAMGDREPDFAAYAGVKQAVVRTYMADFDAIAADHATPGATPEEATPGAVSPEFRDMGMMLMLGTAIEFDTPANAESAFPGLTREVEQNAQFEIGGDTSKFVPVTIDGVGQEAKAFSLTVAADSFGSAGFLILTRQENVIFSVYGMSLNGEAEAATTAFATKLASGAIGSGEPELNSDGTSTGGIWEVFPPARDPSLSGLVPLVDAQVYPKPDATS
jgi:hypothetical protein